MSNFIITYYYYNTIIIFLNFKKSGGLVNNQRLPEQKNKTKKNPYFVD